MKSRNRYRPSNMVEVWSSFEWLFREKLEQLDAMTRQMMDEMLYKGCDQEAVQRYVQHQFAALWAQVAAEEEERMPERKRERSS